MATERCEKCGGEMEYRQEGSVQGLFCTKCDWYLVTTHIPPIQLDETDYEVRTTSGDFKNPAHVKAVAEASGLNFLDSRRLLQGHEPLVYKGKAPEVARIHGVLTAAGVGVRILPPFPHSQRR